MSPQEIVNLRGFGNLKESGDREFELQSTEYGNPLSVNSDTTSLMTIIINKCLLKNPLMNDIIINGLLSVYMA